MDCFIVLSVCYRDREDKSDGFLHREYTRVLKYSTENPSPDDNKKTITCKAKMPKFPEISASAVLEVRCKLHYIYIDLLQYC